MNGMIAEVMKLPTIRGTAGVCVHFIKKFEKYG